MSLSNGARVRGHKKVRGPRTEERGTKWKTSILGPRASILLARRADAAISFLPRTSNLDPVLKNKEISLEAVRENAITKTQEGHRHPEEERRLGGQDHQGHRRDRR